MSENIFNIKLVFSPFMTIYICYNGWNLSSSFAMAKPQQKNKHKNIYPTVNIYIPLKLQPYSKPKPLEAQVAGV